jgi:thiol-disulfide isomerase/thioredoxin
MRSLAVALSAAALAYAEPALAAKPPQKFIVHDEPKALPELSFNDADGRPKNLAEFRGKVVLLNVWATWCVPCREEMPALDRLQAELGGPDFEVVALSIDRAGMSVVRKFFDEIAIKSLAMYIDESGRALRGLGILGLPATLLIDREGREIGRLIGPAKWDAPEMMAFIRSYLSDLPGPRKAEDGEAPPVGTSVMRNPNSAPASGESADDT